MGTEEILSPFSLAAHNPVMKLPLNLRQLILAVTMAAFASIADAAAVPAAEPGGETVLLWPGGAPGAQQVTVHEALLERSPDGPLRDRFAEHVTRPMLTLFEPKGSWFCASACRPTAGRPVPTRRCTTRCAPCGCCVAGPCRAASVRRAWA